MPNTFLLPYDEELLELFNFVINNTDNFKIETTINGNSYDILKTYNVDENSEDIESKLRIFGPFFNDYTTNNSSKESIIIIVERKKVKKENKEKEDWSEPYPITNGYINTYKIRFEKYLGQNCFFNPSKPCLENENLTIEFIYPSNWDESKQDFVSLDIDELKNNPQILFSIYRRITIPEKIGFDYRRFKGNTNPSLKKINVGAPYYSNIFTFEDNKISHYYNESAFKEVNESLIKGRVKDADGFVIPPLYFILANPKYLSLYSDYADFVKNNPGLNTKKHIDLLEMIDIRNTIAGELNSGIGFSKEQMRNFIDTINEKAQIDRPSSNNVLLKTNKKQI